MFWGNDRLEQALAWAAGDRPGKGRGWPDPDPRSGGAGAQPKAVEGA